MQVGLMIPQGWKGEYDGWAPADAWARSIELTRQAEALGFESLWVFDHFHTVPGPDRRDHLRVVHDARRAWPWPPSACASGTWSCAPGFRNPALTAKMSSTIDVISGGRFELGIGAGWKEDEWRAYGYGFPPIGERIDAFGDHLEVIQRMFEPGRATFEGRSRHRARCDQRPAGLQQPRIPIIVGGNGRNRTAGYAIRYADELNYVFIGADDIAERMADGPGALRGRGSRPGHAALLAVHPRRRGRATPAPSAGRPPRRARGHRPGPASSPSRPARPDRGRPDGLRRGLRGGRGQPGGGSGGGGRLIGPIRRHGA